MNNRPCDDTGKLVVEHRVSVANAYIIQKYYPANFHTTNDPFLYCRCLSKINNSSTYNSISNWINITPLICREDVSYTNIRAMAIGVNNGNSSSSNNNIDIIVPLGFNGSFNDYDIDLKIISVIQIGTINLSNATVTDKYSSSFSIRLANTSLPSVGFPLRCAVTYDITFK